MNVEYCGEIVSELIVAVVLLFDQSKGEEEYDNYVTDPHRRDALFFSASSVAPSRAPISRRASISSIIITQPRLSSVE